MNGMIQKLSFKNLFYDMAQYSTGVLSHIGWEIHKKVDEYSQTSSFIWLVCNERFVARLVLRRSNDCFVTIVFGNWF